MRILFLTVFFSVGLGSPLIYGLEGEGIVIYSANGLGEDFAEAVTYREIKNFGVSTTIVTVEGEALRTKTNNIFKIVPLSQLSGQSAIAKAGELDELAPKFRLASAKLKELANELRTLADAGVKDSMSPKESPTKIEITDVNGRIYRGVTVRGIDSDGIRIFHSGGAAKINLEDLTDDTFTRLGLVRPSIKKKREGVLWEQDFSDEDLISVIRPRFTFQAPIGYEPKHIVSGAFSDVVQLSGPTESTQEFEVGHFASPSLLVQHFGDLINVDLGQDELKKFLSSRYHLLNYSFREGRGTSNYSATYLLSEKLSNTERTGYLIQELKATIQDREIQSLEPGAFMLLLEGPDKELLITIRLGKLPRFDWLKVRMDSAATDLVAGNQLWNLLNEWKGATPYSPEFTAVLKMAAKISLEERTPQSVSKFEARFPDLEIETLRPEVERLLPESLPQIGQSTKETAGITWLSPREKTAEYFGRGAIVKRSFINGECLVSLVQESMMRLTVDLIATEFTKAEDVVTFAKKLMERHSESSWESVSQNSNVQSWRTTDSSLFCMAISLSSNTFRKSNFVVMGSPVTLVEYFDSKHFQEGAARPLPGSDLTEESNDSEMVHDIIVFRSFLKAVSEASDLQLREELEYALVITAKAGMEAGQEFASRFGRVPTKLEYQTLIRDYKNLLGLGMTEEQTTKITALVESYSNGFKEGCRNLLDSGKPAF